MVIFPGITRNTNLNLEYSLVSWGKVQLNRYSVCIVKQGHLQDGEVAGYGILEFMV